MDTEKIMLDVEKIRKDFPILSRIVHGKPMAYLDSAATSQKPLAMIEATDGYYREYNANVHRGIYVISEEATTAYEAAREKVRGFINASSVEEIIYTRNATESLNLIRFTWGRQYVGKGDVIIVSEMEHHSNMVPWQMLAKEVGAELLYIPINTETGRLDQGAYQKLLERKPKLVGIVHMSNAMGTLNPMKEMTRLAHEAGAVVVIDGCQSTPHMPVDVQDLDADFFAFSGHKMLGPTGIGILYGKKKILESMQPFMGGGDMIKEVTKEGATWNDLPYKFEAGTPNVAGAIGLGAAVDYLNKVGMANIWEHEQEMAKYVLGKLRAIEGVRIVGPKEPVDRGAAISFVLKGAHPHDMASIFDDAGIAIRAGHLCAQPALTAHGVDAVARASFYLYNTKEEADRFLETVLKVKEIFG
ncbi:MAG TPA: cysteine desulfurase [Candidatus Kerfeldbacteria bacterium]|nr:MAG: Cysteine desulfurase, SufS subfamily [Parcubacteria group bacterium GW2011_GWA2_48_9]KKW16036.1 MAG: Cysteine desulfurase, SufS subfamily [Parcubacteria group bacterium GW2011_GWC2_49_9]HCM68412.1 cysteine desulfurase [Candidatus Kerfeldbacteria bacterium]